MDSFLIPFVILTLIAVIIIQAVERHFYAKQEQVEKSKMIAAIMSKDINDYTHAVRVEKETKVPDMTQPSEINLADADDDEFMKHIKAVNNEGDEE